MPATGTVGPTWENELAPTTNTTTMTTLHNTSAATVSIQRRVQAHRDPANATGANTATTTSAVLRNSSTAHNAIDPTITNRPNSICSTGPACPPDSHVSCRNRTAAASTVVPDAAAITAHTWSVATSADCVTANANAEPTVALPTSRTARPSPPGSRRSTAVATWTAKMPTSTGSVTAVITATFRRNQSADRSTVVVAVNAATAAVLIAVAASTNAVPRAVRTASISDELAQPIGDSAMVMSGGRCQRGGHRICAPNAAKNATIEFAPPISTAPPIETSTPTLPVAVPE